MRIKNISASKAFGLTAILLASLTSVACNDSHNGSKGGSADLSIISTNPDTDAIAVPINNNIIATFNVAMKESTLNTETFTVIGAGEPAIVGVVTLDADSNTAIFNPNGDLTPSTVYTATITTAVKSAAGKSLVSDHVWAFTSDATADLIPPTVSSSDPSDTEIDVALNRNVSAVFDESLDPASVNQTSFTLTAGTTVINGEVSYADKLVTFKPDSNLTASTLYTATLTTDIKDLAGNALAANHSWDFTTGTEIAAGPMPVNLLTAGNFVILSKSGITNEHISDITGDIGASPITAAAMDNVFCTEITGKIYGSDAAYTGSGDTNCFKGAAADNTLVANAVLDMGTAYNDAKGRTTPDFTELHAGDLSGKTLVPGLYKWSTTVSINTDVTLEGSANDVWIFQVEGDVIQAAGTSVLLTGGALAKNVFWQVSGGTGVAINTNATFSGVVLAIKGITVNTGSVVNGRLLSQTAVTLNMNTINQPAP